MTIFVEIIGFINTYFIKGIFISVLVIILTSKLFKKNFDTKNAISIIKWVLLSYSSLMLIYFILLALSPAKSTNYLYFQERAMGPYNFAFWLVALGSVLPLILFFKKLGNRVYFIFILTVFVNLGWLMESLIIHTTSMERDYAPNVSGIKAYLPFNRELMIVLQGALFGALTILIGNSPFLRKNSGR